MDWKDILQDFDVITSRDDDGDEVKRLYIQGLLYNIFFDYTWAPLEAFTDSGEEIIGIYRGQDNYLGRELRYEALRGDIGLMKQVYPIEREKGYLVEIAFTGTEETDHAWCHKDLTEHLDNLYALIADKTGHEYVVEIIQLCETTETREDFDYEVIKGLEL